VNFSFTSYFLPLRMTHIPVRRIERRRRQNRQLIPLTFATESCMLGRLSISANPTTRTGTPFWKPLVPIHSHTHPACHTHTPSESQKPQSAQVATSLHATASSNDTSLSALAFSHSYEIIHAPRSSPGPNEPSTGAYHPSRSL
jgi:hypothetical protein